MAKVFFHPVRASDSPEDVARLARQLFERFLAAEKIVLEPKVERILEALEQKMGR